MYGPAPRVVGEICPPAVIAPVPVQVPPGLAAVKFCALAFSQNGPAAVIVASRFPTTSTLSVKA